MDELDKEIINRLQDGFPVCQTPYAHVARELKISEDDLLQRLQLLLDRGILSRFGPMFDAEKMGGALTLAALKVAEEDFANVTELINSFPEVAHNYARKHELNMWFVLATESLEQIERVISQIERKTGLNVYSMPKIKEYYVGLKLAAE